MLTMDLKSRALSLKFWVFIIAQIGLIAGYFHVDITQYIGQDWQTLLGLIFSLLGALGIAVDTSTKGISDQVISNATVKAINQTKEEIKTEGSTTSINNTITQNSQDDSNINTNNIANTSDKESETITPTIDNSASSKVTVDNPDNIQALGATVNSISAASPSAN